MPVSQKGGTASTVIMQNWKSIWGEIPILNKSGYKSLNANSMHLGPRSVLRIIQNIKPSIKPQNSSANWPCFGCIDLALCEYSNHIQVEIFFELSSNAQDNRGHYPRNHENVTVEEGRSKLERRLGTFCCQIA
jgi:hypothetical protein